MNQDYMKYLAHDARAYVGYINYLTGYDIQYRMDSVAFPVKLFEDCKNPTYLKMAAFNLYCAVHNIMLMYGEVHNLRWNYSSSYEELTKLVAGCCDDGAFLRNIDASYWGNSLSYMALPKNMSWEGFAEQIITYTKGIQSLYNKHIVPAICRELDSICDLASEPRELSPMRRLSNFM